MGSFYTAIVRRPLDFSVFRLYITARLLVQTGHGHFRASILRERHRRDLTPDHRTDIASKVDLANQVDLVPAPLAQAGTRPGAVSIIGCTRVPKSLPSTNLLAANFLADGSIVTNAFRNPRESR